MKNYDNLISKYLDNVNTLVKKIKKNINIKIIDFVDIKYLFGQKSTTISKTSLLNANQFIKLTFSKTKIKKDLYNEFLKYINIFNNNFNISQKKTNQTIYRI